MAKLSTDDVLKLAKLARIKIEESDVAAFQQEINEILGYVETLQSVDVAGVEPTIQVAGLQNVMREDVVKPYQATPEDLLKAAPSTEGSLLKVKRVLQ